MGRPMAQLISVDGAQLEVEEHGSGDAVVLIQTALMADELTPLARQPGLRNGYRTVLYHRRGYAGSSPTRTPGSVVGDANDCQALLAKLGIERAHIVGLSYSASVALQLAVDAPGCVHSLALLEPPPVHVPSAGEFRAANARLREVHEARGPAAALDEFLTLLIGAGWRDSCERLVPGSVEQMQRDAGTFFDVDLPAVLGWRFTAADARRISCPVLHIGGSDSGPWFAEVRKLVLAWLPQTEDVVIAGADHSLATSHPADVADALVRFLDLYPIAG
jgi:pimeloyl-ACP methyl ester carboxylesterase